MFRVKTYCNSWSLRSGVLFLMFGSLVGEITVILGVIKKQMSEEGDRFIVVTVGYHIVILSFILLGLIGVFKKIPTLLIFYMILLWFDILMFVLIMVYVIISPNAELFNFARSLLKMISEENPEAALVIVVVELFAALFVVLLFYFFIVVLSYYEELKEDQSQSPFRDEENLAPTNTHSTLLSSSQNVSLHSSLPSASFVIMQEI